MQVGIVISKVSQSALEPPTADLTPSGLLLWEFPLDIDDPAFAEYQALLSSDERSRASRFRFERDARRYTAARASMRSILARLTSVPPQDLLFTYSTQGKPSLPQAPPDVRFNISHSGDRGLLGVALGRDVGVDIEVMREDVEIDRLARRFFSPQEDHAIHALAPSLQVPAFYRCWTCKEAFLKAQGVGLYRSLSSFDVEVNPERPARLIATRPDPNESQLWSLYSIEAATGFAAAVALDGVAVEINGFRLRGDPGR